MTPLATMLVALLGVSAVMVFAVGVAALRAPDVPGRRPFVLLMFACGVWTAAYGLGLLVPDRTLRIGLESVAWFGRATVHVWIFLFALGYTGYDRYVTSRSVGALLAIPALMVVLVWTNQYHGLVWASTVRLVTLEGLALLVAAVGPAFWLTVVYAYALVAASTVLLVRLILVSENLYADQSALLVVGILAPFVASAVTVFPPHPIKGFDYTTFGFTVTGLTFGYALFRGRLFDLVPATRMLGRSATIEELEAGVVVVDADRTILYCNEAAGTAFGVAPDAVLGESTETLVEDFSLTLGTEDALAEFERDGRIYEVRTSPITDRTDERIGHSLVVHDVTARETRARQLDLLDDVNRVIRGVNQSLVSASTRDEIERALCERVLDADIYGRACVADVPTWRGDADRWVCAGEGDDPGPPAWDGDALEADALALADGGPVEDPPTVDAPSGTWIVVPISYGRTVYGALGLYTERPSIDDREREVLAELGETVGHAIDAVETRQLLSADELVELEVESRDPAAPLVGAATATGGHVAVTALYPRGDGEHVAYLELDGAEPSPVADHLETGASTDVRTVRDDDDGTLVEWSLTGDSLLGTLADEGAHVRRAEGDARGVTYTVELPTDDAVRSLVDSVRTDYAETEVAAKRSRSRAVDRERTNREADVDGLTDRQREVLEAAHRAGYFNWPRDSSAEEVAEALDISSPTLLHHLRKAQKRIVDDVFRSDGDD